MTDILYEAKFREIQKYIPFLQKVIEKLKVNNEQPGENPRKPQLQKMEMLYELLTNKTKKIKMETLMKCEGVLKKLQAKIEKQSTLLQNEDLILNNIKLKQMPAKPSTSTIQNTKDEEIVDVSGPASPPPENIADDVDQPVVIPTERRCSPILTNDLIEDNTNKSSNLCNEAKEEFVDHQHSIKDDFQSLRRKVFPSDTNRGITGSSIKKNEGVDKRDTSHHHHRRHDSRKDAKEHHYGNKQLNIVRKNGPLPKDNQHLQKLQTDRLPAHIKQQDISHNNNFIPISSMCHKNLKTSQAGEKNADKNDKNEVYSPEELWKQYSESRNMGQPTLSTSDKAIDKSSDSIKSTVSVSKPGRYTPIPDVLKSPPLSVSDINNLLLESGVTYDISEIGSRRSVKTEGNQKEFETNSFEFVRKKLAQTAKINSPHSDIPQTTQRAHLDKDNRNTSPLLHERLALKYNPHPRQERPQSVACTESNECSTKTKMSDPRIKQKLQSSNSATQVTPINVNVLPSINQSDPRLKKQNIATLISTSPYQSTTVAYGNQDFMGFSSRKDPRISKVQNSSVPTQIRRLSCNQPYSSEENWDSESEDKTRSIPKDETDNSKAENKFGNKASKTDVKNPTLSKCEFRFDKRDCPKIDNRYEKSSSSIEHSNSKSRNISRTQSSMRQSRFTPDTGSDKFLSSEVGSFQSNSPKSDNVEDKGKKETLKDKSISKTQLSQEQLNISKLKNHHPSSNTSIKSLKSKKHNSPANNLFISNPPNSETEEDWDSEPDVCSKMKPQSHKGILPSFSMERLSIPQAPIHIAPSCSIERSNIPHVSSNVSLSFPVDRLPTQPLISPVQAHVSPNDFGNSIQNSTLQVSPSQNTYRQLQHQIVGPNVSFALQNNAGNNRFSAVLNDKSERIKYLESKKQKTAQPRTYKEFREARERAQAKAIAMQRAADEAESKRQAEEIKEAKDGKDPNIYDKKQGSKMDVIKKISEHKNEKKSLQAVVPKQSGLNKNDPKSPAVQSTLDKMYRTQNFNSNFPKATTSFKIPKKKTEDKPKEATTTSEITEKSKDKVTTNQENENKVEKPSDRICKNKSFNQELRDNVTNKSKEMQKNLRTETENGLAENKFSQRENHNNIPIEKVDSDIPKEKQKNSHATENVEIFESTKDIAANLERKTLKNESENTNNSTDDTDTKMNCDPRHRHKSTATNSSEVNPVIFGDIVITSSENEVILRPQQKSIVLGDKNISVLDKFNEVSQSLNTMKPQKVLRRRNTMVTFESAPLVDKDKLKKANALLYEDVQEQEKRKQKQAEEARRNRHLEEMFQKTNDNCTVSTQNIICGKRRTRTTINFNETANVINIFKHISRRDFTGGNLNVTQSSSQTTKTSRSSSKTKIKNTEVLDAKDDKNVEIKLHEKSQDKELCEPNNSDINKNSSEVEALTEVSVKVKHTSQSEPKPALKCTVKLPKKRLPVNKKYATVIPTTNSLEDTQLAKVKNEIKFKPIHDDEHQNCAVSSTSTETPLEDQTTYSSTSTRNLKKESDDNEPSSTAGKSNNPTPTPEVSVHVLNEIVDQILKPNANREHILGLLGQILSEERLELIKSLIDSSTKHNEEQYTNKANKQDEEDEEDERIECVVSGQEIKKRNQDEEDDNKANRAGKGSRKNIPVKKKRTELDRLNEDIRDMFICEGVLTATGRRMCTIMGQSNGKDFTTINSKKPTVELTSMTKNDNENTTKKKEQKMILEKAEKDKPLRRSLRGSKTNGENEDDDIEDNVIYSRTTEDSTEDSTTTEYSNTDVTPRKKVSVLKPHTSIKMLEEISVKSTKKTESGNRRKSDIKNFPKMKKTNNNTEETKDETNSDHEKDSEVEEQIQDDNIMKNINLHWHNQSKFTAWCMICQKRIPVTSSAFHYKIHHGENYISRLAPVILQKFKQRKLSRPLFGVNKTPKQTIWFYRCPFCLHYFNTPMPLWLEHFQSHTGEFRYECSKCHRGSNRQVTIRRHIKKCEGGTLINSAIKLEIPTLIKAHVCHLCNFLQLKRINLERHYIEQHHLDKKTVELLGYTISLFDIDNVEIVSEDKAAEKEKEVWEIIERQEKIIAIDDGEDDKNTEGDDIKQNEEPNYSKEEQILKSAEQNQDECVESTEIDRPETFIELTKTQNRNGKSESVVQQLQEAESSPTNLEKPIEITNRENVITNKKYQRKTTETNTNLKSKADEIEVQDSIFRKGNETSVLESKEENGNKSKTLKQCSEVINADFNTSNTINNDCKVINEKETVQDLQNELLVLAAEAAEQEGDQEKSSYEQNLKPGTTITDIISNSIDIIYKSGSKRKSLDMELSESKKPCQAASNVFMPTRDENNSSPTIPILAQSIINREEETKQCETLTERSPTISIAEKLSQRFKGLQNQKTNTITNAIEEKHDVPFEKLHQSEYNKPINETVLELEKDKGNTKSLSSQSITDEQSKLQSKEKAHEQLLSEKVLELENDKQNDGNTDVDKQISMQNEIPSTQSTEIVTVLSDDDDWEDIEITETSPNVSSTNASNIQKSKNKGLFQKFGIFKGNNNKSKKHLPSIVFLSKKKLKEKSLLQTTTLSPTLTPTITKVNSTLSATKSDVHHTNINAHLGFKPVINIIDDLLPDSPCNDPIELVPELAPLEPLQDLNDISSILDSNLSAVDEAVDITVTNNNTSIEDALDFISEQQANDKQKSNSLSLKSLTQTQGKTIINNISHVGYSIQTTGENNFKFYCLLQNCTFLYSSDSIGLETHFICEHSQVKWNGYCLMCQTQCFPNVEGSEEHSIVKEIRHMLDMHAKKSHLELNTDSTQHSTTSSHSSDEKPKIKLRRLTGDCLSKATLENGTENGGGTLPTTSAVPTSILGALLVAKPKPPTKEMPPETEMPLTESLLLDNKSKPIDVLANINNDFVITSVASVGNLEKEIPLQTSDVSDLNKHEEPMALEKVQISKVIKMQTLAPDDNSWLQEIEKDRQDLVEDAEESQEVSQILADVVKPSSHVETSRAMDDSPGPVIVAETVPLAQAKTGDFVITQTVSARYNEFSSTALGFDISIAATAADKTHKETLPVSSSTPITSRQYKCMANGCKFVSRVPVAMSDHLRFHERRNFSNKRDYFDCGFCFFHASDVEDYMKHADQYHIINKGAAASSTTSSSTEIDTATSLTKKIQEILNSNNNSPNTQSKSNMENQLQNETAQEQDTHTLYLKKLKDTIDEIVGPTGLSDDKLYRCVIKGCRTQLTETTFLNHIIYHISATGGNPNNYIFKCPHCTAQYHRAAGIKVHIKNHARNRYFCYLCEQTSTNPGQLLKHFSEKHWHTLNMYTKELLKPKITTDGSEEVIDSGYYVVYTQELSDEEVKKFGEKLILEWQRKKSGSKTHFKSSEIDLLPLAAIFQREINCGECEYKTKVRTNMFRHLQMHKQNPGLSNSSGITKVYNVDPVNPVPCLNSSERFFDKMTNLASSSLIPPSSSINGNSSTKCTFKMPYVFVMDTKRYTCGCTGCKYLTISEDIFRTHLTTLHSTAMTYRCTFCQEEICKRGITTDRIINHLRFHGSIIYRCEECNYLHHLRYVVERHINERHSTSKVNIIMHERSSEDNAEGTTKVLQFTGKKYKENLESNQSGQSSNVGTRSGNGESSGSKQTSSSANSIKGKGKWICDVCGHKASTVGQIQTHCQQHHGVKNQYKCAHCNFGSQQLSQILFHIDGKHPGKTREARNMYHKPATSSEEVADTRPLWQRNDPTRVRHIRGILMEDEEESEQYRKNLGLSEDLDDDEDNKEDNNVDINKRHEEISVEKYISGYEFGCFHCNFRTQTFDILKYDHYANVHNSQLEFAKPFWYRLHRRLCCPECCSFIGNYIELQEHIQSVHQKSRYYAADVTVAENGNSSKRILCGYCSFHCTNIENLHRHHLKVQHLPQDIRIDNNEQVMDILALGKTEISYQCTLCADIFPNRVAIVQHACNSHAGEDSFSFRELTNSLIYRCATCHFTSTRESDLLKHMVDHYSRFKICHFCRETQSSFNVYMQHCYAEHRNDIQKFKSIYPLMEIRKYLLQMLMVFPSGLVLNKRNLLNTKYGKTDAIEELYDEIYKISQQPPIPRLSIARLVARKSIEAQQKNQDSIMPQQQQQQQIEVLGTMLQTRPKLISKRRCTVAVDQEDRNDICHTVVKEKLTTSDAKMGGITKRRTTVDHDSVTTQQEHNAEFNTHLGPKKISKRRCTVAVDHDPSLSVNFASPSDNLLIASKFDCGKKRKLSGTSTPLCTENNPLSCSSKFDMEPFSFYGQTPEPIDLSKTFTKVAIGGIKTPLTIDKFKLLFNIDCQLKLTKCDDTQKVDFYNDYKHIKKACPASHKLRFK